MLSLLLPRRCLHCDEPATQSWLLKRSDYPLASHLCITCSRILEADEPPSESAIMERTARVSDVKIAGAYAPFNFMDEAPIQSLIHGLKYSGMMRLGRTLGAMAAESVSSKCDYIVPVPLHRTRRAERGYNQAHVLATGLGQVLRTPIADVCTRIRPTPTQTRLSLPERVENVRGAFALRRRAKSIAAKDVLVVDDVMTTGATIMSVCETIADAKPNSISVLALAAVTY